MEIRIAAMDGDINTRRDKPRSWSTSLATMTILSAFSLGLMVLPNDAFAGDKNAKVRTGQQSKQRFGNNQSWGLFGNNQGWGTDRFGNNQGWGTDKFGNQSWTDKNRKNNAR